MSSVSAKRSQSLIASYDSVAAEYYDARLHPTCRNFRDGSRLFIKEQLLEIPQGGWTLEVGAGASLLCDLGRTDQLILLDSSAEMLAHSRQFRTEVHFVVSDAAEMPIFGGSISLIVASLADPYNIPEFWSEAYRSLRPGAFCVFTVPSYEWASSFRRRATEEREDTAHFVLANREHLYLPSLIRTESFQIEMMERAGLEVVRAKSISAAAIPAPHSSKIEGCESIVTGYLLRRPL